MTTTENPAVDLTAVEAFAEKVSTDQAVATNAVLAYLGDALGIWRALACVTDTTSGELAGRTGLAERYLREWLAAQAAAGYLRYDAGSGRFSLPGEHAAVLADDDSPASLSGGFEFLAGVWAGVDRLGHAFATGEGVAWGAHDSRVFSGVERFFRPLYQASLLRAWLPAVDGLVGRLESGMRVLDVGCGLGSATLMMAAAFPRSTFVGLDNHAESVRRAVAAGQGLDGGTDGMARVRFETADATGYAGGPFDLICFFDALHDLGDPLGALRHAREHLAPDGVVLAVEPAAADRVEANLHPLGLSWYASSTLVCVPGSLSQPGQAALGAQAGPERLLALFHEAGFATAWVAGTTPYNLVIEARSRLI